ncbi:MAG: TonB-dependent receptor [Desulfobacteraceae bacterium]|nr:MAG: TonB-dependent receptor [Desulfobacteraceae bacterium]
MKKTKAVQQGGNSSLFQPAAIRLFCSALCMALILDGAEPSAAGAAGDPQTSTRQATAKPGAKPVQLEPVIVTATRVAADAGRVPAAVTTLKSEDIQQGRPAIKLNDALVRVPGVFVQNEENFAQDLRVDIRGFGARSAFGIRGIQIYVDGIPHTLPDGQSAFDTVDPEVIAQLEVLRGPISALYGNSAGGVINITTQDGPAHPFWEARAVAGEHGLWKSLLKGGGQNGALNYFASLSHVESDGFRAHSRAKSTLFNGKLRRDIDAASDMTLILSAVRTPEAQDPGGLTAAQADADPSLAAALNLLYGAGETVSDQRVGLIYRRELFARQNLEVAGFFNRRDLENAIPFRFIELDRRVAGGRIQYDLSGMLFGYAHRLVSGIDLQHQADDRVNYDNIGGEPGGTLLLAQDEAVTALGVHLQEEVDLACGLSVLLGGRYDNVRFAIDDHFPSDADDSGSKTFDQFTGRFGLMYTVHPGLRLYGNLAQSFETPTTTEVVNRPEGGGGINPDIEPQRAVNYEIGLKMDLGRGFKLDAALFLIRLEDELIAFRDATDRVFYRNAGESRRVGAELGITKRFGQAWRFDLAYTYLEPEFERYVKQGLDLAGKHVPGVPEQRLFAELRYAHASGVYAAGSLRYAGAFFVDDENTLKNDPATVLDVRLGIEKKLRHWLVEPFLGMRNLLDEEYNNNVRINAAGGRYFEPAPRRNFYGGLRVSHQWL